MNLANYRPFIIGNCFIPHLRREYAVAFLRELGPNAYKQCRRAGKKAIKKPGV